MLHTNYTPPTHFSAGEDDAVAIPAAAAVDHQRQGQRKQHVYDVAAEHQCVPGVRLSGELQQRGMGGVTRHVTAPALALQD